MEIDYYYDFTRRVLASMGIEVGVKSNFKIWMTFLRFFTPTMILASSLQSLWYFLATEGRDYFRVASLATFFFCSQSSLKSFVIAFYQDEFKSITDRLKILYQQLTTEEKAKSSIRLARIRRICKIVFIAQMACIWSFNLLPFVSILIAFLQGQELKYNFPYGFGWPFDPFDYYYVIFAYQLYAGQILMIGQIIMDEYFSLIITDLVAHFDRFGERLQAIINDGHLKKFESNKIKIRGIIEQHNNLIGLFEELNGLYNYALLYQVLSGSVIICFLLYMIMTQPLVYSIPLFFGLINSLAQLFLPCWAGESIKGCTLKLPDNIFYSDFYKLDKSLQKDLILIIKATQKPLLVKASKFFYMSLTGYASIIQSAFSYFTLLRRVFNKQ